jgi:hypothetical protein
MTNEFLSEDANRLVDLVRQKKIDVRQLIASYDAWRSDEHPSPDEPPAGLADRMLSDVRAQMGIRSGMAGELEACGDAIRALAAEADDDIRSAWHDAKLRAIGGTDRDKKLLAMRHLDGSDYGDEALLAALIESLGRDEERIALTFGITSAMNVDPSQHEETIRLLLNELAQLERRGQSRAAHFATTIQQAFEQHPAAVPPRWLTDEWAAIVNDVADPASFAALNDLCAVAVVRSSDLSLLERWLRSEREADWTLAIAIIRNIGLGTLAENLRRSLCSDLRQLMGKLTSAAARGRLSEDAAWVEAAVREQLTNCL